MYRTRLCAVCATSPPPPFGASEHALHWPQGTACRRTRSAAAMRSTRRPVCSRLRQCLCLAQ
eukprot:194987-Pleurochrysis_carterae.AAC.1